MRVVVAVADKEGAEWLTEVLSSAGYSVALLENINAQSPELHNAELLIVDREQADAVGEAGPRCRILLAPRGGTIELADLERGFADVIGLPTPADEVVARIEHAIRRTV